MGASVMSFCTCPNKWLRRPQTVLQRALLLSLILGAAVVVSSDPGAANDSRQSTEAATPAPDRAAGDAAFSGAMSGTSAPTIADGPVEALPQSHSPESVAADRQRRALLVLILRGVSRHINPFPR